MKVTRPKLSREQKARRASRARILAALGAETVEDVGRLRYERRARERAEKKLKKNRRFKAQDDAAMLSLYRGLAGVVLWHARKATEEAP